MITFITSVVIGVYLLLKLVAKQTDRMFYNLVIVWLVLVVAQLLNYFALPNYLKWIAASIGLMAIIISAIDVFKTKPEQKD
ncbi:MAG: hypothetical protein AAFX57_16195 [Bacteroidota bacterium]